MRPMSGPVTAAGRSSSFGRWMGWSASTACSKPKRVGYCETPSTTSYAVNASTNRDAPPNNAKPTPSSSWRPPSTRAPSPAAANAPKSSSRSMWNNSSCSATPPTASSTTNTGESKATPKPSQSTHPTTAPRGLRPPEHSRGAARSRTVANAPHWSERVRRGYDTASYAYRADDAESGPYANWIHRLDSALSRSSRVVDLGCGCGVPIARDLAAAGHAVVGVDISQTQIERARRLVPAGEVHCND